MSSVYNTVEAEGQLVVCAGDVQDRGLRVLLDAVPRDYWLPEEPHVRAGEEAADWIRHTDFRLEIREKYIVVRI